MYSIMSSSNSFDSPVRSHGSYGEFVRPQFSPSFTSSPMCRNDSSDFIPFGPSPPGHNRGRGRWRGRNRSFMSNTSTSSGHNSSFSPGIGERPSPYKQNSPHGHWRGRGNKGNFRNHNQRVDISAYFHPSMLEDPWAVLEEKLENDLKSNSQCSSTSTRLESDTRNSDTESSVENEPSIEISSQESVS
ncbi:hypothetical protein R5R35_008346 [Gryllus longicercus]|uniref:Uncharacterized protein n=1 Tax=Gryllus longicercus TaxID=2509291 RepID=A0AAN9VAW1_9ORTH|nr:Uncharacterized protein GBIM_06064 [Gryllus bimaculatus]